MKSNIKTTLAVTFAGFGLFAMAAAVPVFASGSGSQTSDLNNGSSSSTNVSHQAISYATKDYQNTTTTSDKEVQLSIVNDKVSTQNNTGNNGPTDHTSYGSGSGVTTDSKIKGNTGDIGNNGSSSSTDASHQAVSYATKDMQNSSTTSDKEVQLAVVNDQAKTQDHSGGKIGSYGNNGSSSSTDASHQALSYATKDYYNQNTTSDKGVQFSMVNDHVNTQDRTGNSPWSNNGSSSSTDASHQAVNFASMDLYNQSTTADKEAQFSMVNDHANTQNSTNNNPWGNYGYGSGMGNGSNSSMDASHFALSYATKDFYNQNTTSDKQVQFASVNDQFSSLNRTGGNSGYGFGGSGWSPLGSMSATNASHQAVNFASQDYFNQSTTSDQEVQFALVNDLANTNFNNGGLWGNNSSTNASHFAINFATKDLFSQTTTIDKQVQFSMVNDQASTFNNAGGFGGGMWGSTPVLGSGLGLGSLGSISPLTSIMPVLAGVPFLGSPLSLGFSSNLNLSVQMTITTAINLATSFNLMFA